MVVIAFSGFSNHQLNERSRLCLASLESGIVFQEFFCAETSQQPLSASLQKARENVGENVRICSAANRISKTHQKSDLNAIARIVMPSVWQAACFP